MNRSQRNGFPSSGVPVVTAEDAELGITADKLVMVCWRGAL